VRDFQLEAIAALSARYGNGIVHVTTRQDLQIHEVNIEDTPDVLDELLKVGLSARGGGGNTVRNVTACQRAGVCPAEVFDVAPYSIAAAEYLLQDRSSFNLPRKYKIVFSGCPSDCAFASVADLGFFAKIKDGQKGFEVYAGGGLGGSPRTAVKIEDFIADDQVCEVSETIKRLFDKHGDRSNRNRARLRYVLDRLGEEEFVKLYKQFKQQVQTDGLTGEKPALHDVGSTGFDATDKSLPDELNSCLNILSEKNDGRFSIKLRLQKGDISADRLTKLADIAKQFSNSMLRTTQTQGFMLCGVAAVDVAKVIEAVKPLGIDVLGDVKPKVVACAGAATCKLGLCLSRGLADAITDKLNKTNIAADITGSLIRISGCPNSCGNHYLTDIGLQGRAKRIAGRLMPYYDVLVGAKVAQGQTVLGKRVASVPAKRLPDMFAELFADGDLDETKIAEVATRFAQLPDDVPEDYYYDYDASEPFSLAGRGPGECGAGVMDIIRVDIDNAQTAVKAAADAAGAKAKSDALYKAILASASALLVVFGKEPKKDREIFAAFAEHIIADGWVKADTQQLLDAAVDYKLGDTDSLTNFAERIEELTERISDLFISLDSSLKFGLDPIEKSKQQGDVDTDVTQTDLRGVGCPINFVKAKIALEQIQVGAILEILLDDGAPAKNVPDSFAEQGQEVISVEPTEDYFTVKVRRKK
jgi:sulfite reductase (ferredoxin)